jgi:hypothetical protein
MTDRATSNYTLTLQVPDPASALPVLYRVLDDAGIIRTSTVIDDDHAGVAWRATTDTQAKATAALIEFAVMDQQTVLSRRLHTGYGAHTRELVATVPTTR